MRINRIVDGKIYVGWEHGGGDDGLPWCEGNLILDSEWGPTLEKLAKENAVPVIEKGVPMPPIKPDQRRERGPSKWVAFLKSLEVGDSFLVEYPPANTVKAHARELGIKLVWRYEGKGPENMAQERIWRAE
jgi:hypothetical protein